MKDLTQSEKLFMLFQRAAGFVGRGRQPHHGGGGHGQAHVLSLLSGAPRGQKELLEALGVRAGSLSELLGKLEAAGYITRTKDETDSRAVNVAITEAGEAIAAEHGRHRAEIADAFFAALSDDEKAALTALLEKLMAAWRQERAADDFERRGHGHRGGFGGMRGAPRGDFGEFPAEIDGRGHRGHGRDFGARGERMEHDHRGHGRGFGHERDFHGHGRGEEITDPALKAYLDGQICDGCDKGCTLSAPRCGKGAAKQREAVAGYNK
jgi:DNA-binding MarR family transcriptional regulator